MALSCKVGTETLHNDVEAHAHTGVGFLPKALIVWGDQSQTVAGAGADARLVFGVASGASAEAGVTVDSLDAQATSDTSRGMSTTQLLPGGMLAGTSVDVTADLASFDADGFTLNYTSVFASTANLFHYLALGGDDLTNAKVGTFTSHASTGNDDITGVGFQPDCVLLFGVGVTAADVSIHGLFCLGAFNAAGEQWAVSICDDDAEATATDARRRQRTDKCFSLCSLNDAVLHEATFVSMDTDGFTINWSTASARLVGYLALKGGQYQLGAISQKTSTGTQAYTGTGFEPVGLLLASFCNVATTDMVTHARLALGAANSATSRAASWYGSADGAADSVADSAMATTVAITLQTEGTPTEDARADLESFDADGFTLDWEAADATARELVYLAFGSNAEGGGGGAAPRIQRRALMGIG